MDLDDQKQHIQKLLDFLDEEIDTMELSKSKGGDTDTSSARQAKRRLQDARERFSKGRNQPE
jgi:hypothetical protein